MKIEETHKMNIVNIINDMKSIIKDNEDYGIHELSNVKTDTLKMWVDTIQKEYAVDTFCKKVSDIFPPVRCHYLHSAPEALKFFYRECKKTGKDVSKISIIDILNFLFEKIPEERRNKFDKICELFSENTDEK
jgi:hypothetical protein